MRCRVKQKQKVYFYYGFDPTQRINLHKSKDMIVIGAKHVQQKVTAL